MLKRTFKVEAPYCSNHHGRDELHETEYFSEMTE